MQKIVAVWVRRRRSVLQPSRNLLIVPHIEALPPPLDFGSARDFGGSEEKGSHTSAFHTYSHSYMASNASPSPDPLLLRSRTPSACVCLCVCQPLGAGACDSVRQLRDLVRRKLHDAGFGHLFPAVFRLEIPAYERGLRWRDGHGGHCFQQRVQQGEPS